MADLIKDLSVLTTIPQCSIGKLVEKSNYCICYDIEESINKGDDITDIDIGIGRLLILVDKDEIKYKFVPSRELERNIIKTIESKSNPLTDKVEATLKDKVLNVYKELF